ASCREYLAIGEQCKSKVDPTCGHASGGCPGTGCRVVQLGTGKTGSSATSRRKASGHEHPAVLQQNRVVAVTRNSHAPGECPLASRGVIQFSAGKNRCIVSSSGHEHLPVREDRGCMFIPRHVHASGVAPIAGSKRR